MNTNLLDTEKQKLYDLAKQNIAKAGGDTAAGIKATQDYLASAKNSAGVSALDVAKQKYANEYSAPSKTDLETKIKSGNFSASDTKAYNQLVGNNNGARNIALTSPEAVTTGNLNTNITSPEATMMQNAGITRIDRNQIGITPEEKAKYQANNAPITPKPTTTTPNANGDRISKVNGLNYNEDGSLRNGGSITDLSKIQTVDDWKKQTGGGLNNLESWIESRYGTTATQENGKIKASIGDKAYERNLDNAGNPIKTEVKQQATKDDLVNTMLMGGEVNKNDPNYTKAIDSYNKISNLINANGRQILDSINAGIISEADPEFIKLGQLNPNGIQEYKIYKENQRLADQINNDSKNQYTSLSSVNGYDSSKSVGSQTREPTTVMDFIQDLSDKVSKDAPPDIVSLMKEKISQNPEVISLSNQLSDYNLQLQQLEQQKINIEDTIKAELKGSGATADYIEAKIRVRTNEISKEENNIILLANNTQSKLTTLTNNAKDEINAMQQQYAMEQQQYQNQLDIAKMGMSEAIRLDERAYQEQQIKEQRAYEAQQKEEELKQQFDYTYGDINSEDPRIQKTAFMKMAEFYQNQYKGMPFRRDIQTMANDMMNEFNSGKSIDEITKQLTTDIQNSPYYEQWKASVGLTPQEQDYGFSNVGGGVIAVTDPKTGNVSFQSQGGTITNNTMQKQEGDVGGECGTFARQYVGIEGSLNNVVGSTINERKTKFKDETPKVGGLALFTDGYNSKYGHIAVVESINDDGTLNIVESNLKEDGKVSRRKVNQNQVYGFYNNTPLANGETQTGGQAKAYGDSKVQDYVNALSKTLTSGQKDNKGEQTRILSEAKRFIQEGLTIPEALLKFSGVMIDDPKNKQKAYDYLNAFYNIKNPPVGFELKLSNYINNGDNKALSNYVTKYIDNDVVSTYKDQAVTYPDLKTQTENISDLVSLISKNKDKIGLVSGNINNLITKFKGDEDFVKIKSKIQMLQADIRKYFAGSAVTETEMKALENFIGGTEKMNPDNLITQIKSVNDNTRKQYENQRANYGITPANTRLKSDVNTNQSPTTGNTRQDLFNKYF